MTQGWEKADSGRPSPAGSRGAQDRKAPQRNATWPPWTLGPGHTWMSAAAACRLIEECNPACVPPAPICRVQRARTPPDQRGGEGPRAQPFLHLPGSGLQPLDGQSTGQRSLFLPTCPTPSLSLKGARQHLAFALSPIQSNFLLLLCCFVNKWARPVAQAGLEAV